MGLSHELSQVLAQYDGPTVEKYIEVVEKKDEFGRPMTWHELEEEGECVAVLEMLKCVGGSSAVMDTQHVELFPNTLFVFVCH